MKDHFDWFKNHAEVMENDGGELGTEMESLKQDKTFNESSESEQELEDNTKAVKERTREKFSACG